MKKKIMVLILIILLVSTIANAAITKPKEPKTSTSGSGTGATQATGPSFVLNSAQTIGGNTYPVGTVVRPPYGDLEQALYNSVRSMPNGDIDINKATQLDPRTAAYVSSNRDYTYSNGKFTYSSDWKRDDGLTENYRHKTDVTITLNADGTSTKTTKTTTQVCGEGLSVCKDPKDDGNWATVSTTGAVEVNGFLLDTNGQPIIDKSTGKHLQGVTEYVLITYGADGKPTSARSQQFTITESGEKIVSGARVYTSSQLNADGTPKTDAKPIYTIDKDGKETFEQTEYDKLNDAQKKEVDRQQDRAQVDYVNSGAAGWSAFSLLSAGRLVGRAMRAFDEYSGLRAYSAIGLGDYEEDVQKRKQKIIQEFCLASGITNCAVSAICSAISPIKADNVLSGRGPGGRFVSSALLNAERSLPIELTGLSRQQLIDLFGNSTTIGGRYIDLTDPNFKPETLGLIKLRLYHVQYSITNNGQCRGPSHGWTASDCEQKDMTYNLEFKIVGNRQQKGPNIFGQNITIPPSYGVAIREAKWWTTKPPKLEYQKTDRKDIYKWSATDWTDICLTFDPGLPSGGAGSPGLTNKLCVPFVEYTGGPQDIEQGESQESEDEEIETGGLAPGATV